MDKRTSRFKPAIAYYCRYGSSYTEEEESLMDALCFMFHHSEYGEISADGIWWNRLYFSENESEKLGGERINLSPYCDAKEIMEYAYKEFVEVADEILTETGVNPPPLVTSELLKRTTPVNYWRFIERYIESNHAPQK